MVALSAPLGSWVGGGRAPPRRTSRQFHRALCFLKPLVSLEWTVQDSICVFSVSSWMSTMKETMSGCHFAVSSISCFGRTSGKNWLHRG